MAFQAASNWLPVQLWLHRGTFGRLDPVLGYDIGFYIFTLPLIDDIASWLLVLLALSAAASIAIYILGGRLGMTPRAGLFVAPGPATAPGDPRGRGIPRACVRCVVHPRTSAPLAVGPDFRRVLHRRRESASRPRASSSPSRCCAPRSRWWLPADRSARSSAAIALYVLTAIGAGVIAGAVQRFVVGPNEQARETPYMTHNIAATRQAFGLDHVEERELSGDATLASATSRRTPTR